MLWHISRCEAWGYRPSHCLAISTCLRPFPAWSFLHSPACWVVQLNHLKTDLFGYRCLKLLCSFHYYLFWFEVRYLHSLNWNLFWLEVRELPFLTIESSSSLISLIYNASKLDLELTSSRRPRSILSFFISFARKLVLDFDLQLLFTTELL